MLEGRIELRSRGLRRVDDADLWFSSSGGEALYPNVGHRAHRCPDCDTVVVLGEAGEALRCFECGAAIESDADQCAACGWSYR